MQLHTKIWRKTCCTEDRKVTCTITNPSRSLTENHITSLADGTYRIGCYTPFEEVFSVCSWLALTTTNALDECGVYNDCPKINCAKHIYCSKKRELVCGISHRGQEKTFRNCCKLRKVNCILKTGWRKMYDGQCGKCA
ncbi:uncharacterized protein LOC142331049 isoform X2 [Lycorma delicatula]|uniref:uncharacterized protein LOC142331049 isoform X2 n=1 Tax=Lycorma delicatula TaxID=130591 RepID=UPI003F512592